MTWGDFKEAVEAKGVKDYDLVAVIGIEAWTFEGLVRDRISIDWAPTGWVIT